MDNAVQRFPLVREQAPFSKEKASYLLCVMYNRVVDCWLKLLQLHFPYLSQVQIIQCCISEQSSPDSSIPSVLLNTTLSPNPPTNTNLSCSKNQSRKEIVVPSTSDPAGFYFVVFPPSLCRSRAALSPSGLPLSLTEIPSCPNRTPIPTSGGVDIGSVATCVALLGAGAAPASACDQTRPEIS